MALIDLSRRGPAVPLRGVFSGLVEMLVQPAARSRPDDAERRDFVLDTLREHGDAFRSEADVQCMMSVYPGRF